MTDGPESEAEMDVQAERDRHELHREQGALRLAAIVRRQIDRRATDEDETPPLPPAA